MEFLNKIELRGVIGNIVVHRVADTEVARFSVATDYAFEQNGCNVIDTTWHQVTAFKGDQMPDFSELHRGLKVYVTGRLRMQRYIGFDGVERFAPDVFANEVKIVEE